MVINKCDVCLTEWDPRQQEHRRGVDCASGLKGLIDNLYGLLKRMEIAFAEAVRAESKVEDATVDAFKDVRQIIDALEARHEKLAKRVTLIEHPDLAKVPSMEKAKKS